MNLLAILILINCGLILVYFLSGTSKSMTYTETIIARKIGSYIFTLLALSVISLMLLNVMKAIMIIAYIINIILACILFGLMIRRFLKT